MKVIHWSFVFAVVAFLAVAEYAKTDINPIGMSASIVTAIVIGLFIRPLIK